MIPLTPPSVVLAPRPNAPFLLAQSGIVPSCAIAGDAARARHSAAIELSRSHPQSICVALHPGTVETPFTEKYLGRHPSVPPAEAAENLLGVLDGLGPENTGGFFDWAGKAVAW